MGKKRQRRAGSHRGEKKDPHPDPLPEGEGVKAAESQSVDAATRVSERLIERLAKLPHERFPDSTEPKTLAVEQRLAWLTERERDVLRLYLDLHNSKEIARRLRKSVQTVKNQIASIEHKLGVDSREDLLAFLFALLR